MRLMAGLILLFLTLQGAATLMESTRGERGILVALCVLFVAIGIQRIMHGERLRDIGVRTGNLIGLGLAMALSAVLMLAAAIYLLAVNATVDLYPNAPWLAVGILAQGGFAEELVFRGYLYGKLRRTRGFWRAATAAMLPFAAVHLITFLTMDWPIALAATSLSMVLTLPYAYLYERSGNAIWAPSLLHALTQAAPKLVVVDDVRFPLIWMALVMVTSLGPFLLAVRFDGQFKRQMHMPAGQSI